MIKNIILGIVLILHCGLLSAQESDAEDRDQLYVTDQLRLSLYVKPSAQSKILEYLSSGDLLLIEQLSGSYALVTTPSGTKGWVKRGFLVSTPTSNLMLKEEQDKVESLELELGKLNNSKVVIDQYEKDMDDLVVKMEALENENLLASESIAIQKQKITEQEHDLTVSNVEPLERLPVWPILWQILQDYWHTIVPIILGAILFIFLVSKVIVETRIKSKFHGIKIW